MNGSAPNCPATGSHTCVRQKFKPNFSIDSIDCRVNSNPIPTTTRMRTAMKAPVPRRNPRSVAPPRLDFHPGISVATLRDLDLLERRQFHLDDRVRERRVAEPTGGLLAVAQRPLHEVHHDLRLPLVFRVLVE